MNHQIVKVQKFEIAAFEVLDNAGSQLVKGGFSTAYAGGIDIKAAWNDNQCKCTVNNNVPQCGGPCPTTTSK